MIVNINTIPGGTTGTHFYKSLEGSRNGFAEPLTGDRPALASEILSWDLTAPGLVSRPLARASVI
jgi:hypothetical protein